MEVIKIIFWESRVPPGNEVDTLVISKKDESPKSMHTNLEEQLLSIAAEHAELEAIVEGTHVSIPTAKMFEAIRVLRDHGIAPAAHVDLMGCGRRNPEPCVY